MKQIVSIRLVLVVCVFSMMIAAPLMGQEFPTRTIQIVGPFPPGGSTDLVARILSPRLTEYLGKPVVVLNKAGAGGAVALQFVAGSKPDGYTLITIPPNLVIIPFITPNVTFSYQDFQPVSLAVSMPYVTVVDAKSPWRALEDLVDYGKKNPEKLNHGGAGAGAMSTFIGDWFSSAAGIKITQIPYVGEGPALVALLGGQASFNCCSIPSAINYIKSGQVRVLAVMTPERYKGLPNVPTMGEKGYPDCTFINWHMYMVPAKTPKHVVDKLAEAFQKVLREEDTIKALENVASVVENRGPEESMRILKNDDQLWGNIIKRAGSINPGK